LYGFKFEFDLVNLIARSLYI